MSKARFNELIPQIYRRNYESMGLFFFIKAQLQVFPTMTITQAILNFRRLTGIGVDDWDDDSMKVTYNRLQKDFYECSKKDKGDIRT